MLDRALMHCDSVYNIPVVRAVGMICKTNQSSNTAFRGFGGPQVRTSGRASFPAQAARKLVGTSACRSSRTRCAELSFFHCCPRVHTCAGHGGD